MIVNLLFLSSGGIHSGRLHVGKPLRRLLFREAEFRSDVPFVWGVTFWEATLWEVFRNAIVSSIVDLVFPLSAYLGVTLWVATLR